MGRAVWTTSMDERLRSLYGVMPTRELAAELGVSEQALWSRARRAGLTTERCGYSGEWFPEELDVLRATYPLIGSACGPLCNHSQRQAASRATYERLRRLTKRHKVPRNALRRKSVIIAARWCVTHGVPTERTLEACAEAAGCTPQMMRLVLPQLLADERRRRKR